MKHEEQLKKTTEYALENGATDESIKLTFLGSIATSLAVIADKLTEKEEGNEDSME